MEGKGEGVKRQFWPIEIQSQRSQVRNARASCNGFQSWLFPCVQFFHLCSIYASFLPVRTYLCPSICLQPHKSPNFKSLGCPAVPQLLPVFICQLTANPHRLYLFSKIMMFSKLLLLYVTSSCVICFMHASMSLSILIFAYFQPRAVAEYFLFVYSEFLLLPSRVDGWCRHILNSIPATTIRI